MNIEMKKVVDLIPYDGNPRENEEAVAEVMESIKEFGFKVPIVVDSGNVIVAGHTRLKASERLKMEEVPTIVASDLTDKQIRAFRIADNKTSEKALWNEDLLKDELEELEGMFTGFSDDEITILGFPELGIKEKESKEKDIEMRIRFENINEFRKMEEELSELIREKYEKAKVSITGGEI